jgi:hypothetical protein
MFSASHGLDIPTVDARSGAIAWSPNINVNSHINVIFIGMSQMFIFTSGRMEGIRSALRHVCTWASQDEIFCEV